MSHQLIRFLCSILFLGIASTSLANNTNSLATFDNQYKARLYGFSITVTNRLTKTDDNQYDLLFKMDSMLGSITEISSMQLSDENIIQPLHYNYKRRGLGKNRDADLSFNWEDKTVINNVENTRWKMDIADHAQDKLSYQLQMVQELRAGKKKFNYNVADGGELKDYAFEVLDEEMLDTPLGKVKAVKVKRSRSNNKRITYAWLAPDWEYLLVRLQQEEGGKSYTIYINKASINGKNIEKF